MIVVKFKAIDPREIREQAKAVFGLVEPSPPAFIVPAGGVQLTEEEVAELKDAKPGEIVEVGATKKRGGRKKAAEAAPAAQPDELPEVIDVPAKPAETDDVGEIPEFLDQRGKKVEAAAPAAEATLEAVREALSKVIATAGNNPKVVFDLFGRYKTADGAVCKKASEVLPADRAKLIADVEAHLAKG